MIAALRWLFNALLGLIWMIAYVIVRVLIMMRRWLPPSILLLIFVIVPLLGVSLPHLDRVGSYVMVAAAVALAFIAGTMARRK